MFFLQKDEIENRIKHFREDLLVKSDDEIISKYYYNDFAPAAMDIDTYHKLRLLIKKKFNLDSIFNVILIGSGRLGFSIKPTQEYRLFGEESDLDFAVISKSLFLSYWKLMRDKKPRFADWKKAKVFEDYFFNGWMRPDMLPPEKILPDPHGWWGFFNEISASGEFGNISIRGGLYYSLEFLESYQKQAFQNLRVFEEVNK